MGFELSLLATSAGPVHGQDDKVAQKSVHGVSAIIPNAFHVALLSLSITLQSVCYLPYFV